MTKYAELYACLCAKEFPAQALLRLRPELRNKPVAVLDGEPPLQQVCSCNSRARGMGVASGMTRVEVETFPSVTVLPRLRTEETTAKAALLECMGTFSPRMEERCSDKAFLCVIDIAGNEKLFGPPDLLARNLLERVRWVGVVASVAVSSNFHAAVCLSCGMPGNQISVIPPGEESKALSSLPLGDLDVSEQHAETFSMWGIETFGMLADLPEKELIARLGQEGKRLRQLARGELPHLFLPVEPPFRLEEHVDLDTPVELLESLLFVVGVMLQQLIVRATARNLALASVTIALSLEDKRSHTRTVKPALPSNDRQIWIKLLHPDLAAHPPQTAIISVTLTAEPGRTSEVQFGLFSPQMPEPLRLDVTLARIRAVVGEDCAGRVVLNDTHRPDSFRIQPFVVPTAAGAEIAPTQPRVAMRQLRPAENMRVTLREERPAAFFFHKKRYAVEHAYGPWLVSGDWWSSNYWGLEQWDLVARSNDDAVLCCCLIRDLIQNCWKIVALYD